MTPYWWVAGTHIEKRMASEVETERVRDADGGEWTPRRGPEVRDYGAAYLDRSEAIAAVRSRAIRDAGDAQKALGRALDTLDWIESGRPIKGE